MFRHIILLALCSCTLSQRTYLRADGDSDGTYALLNRILGGTAYEVPDCVHPIKHITQLNDAELGVHVFQFSSHVDIDNDRCQNFDRMRTEIKTYASSPSHMKCFLGESVSYSWDLRINSQFQPSTSFTHLFQIKAVDGDDSLPFITISPVLVSGQKLIRVLYRQLDQPETVLWQGDLASYVGRWLHITTEYTCTTNGKFHIRMKRKDNDQELMTYTNNNLKMWNAGNSFLRPKWGIYRSLKNRENLRDEFVLFNNFCLAKGQPLCN